MRLKCFKPSNWSRFEVNNAAEEVVFTANAVWVGWDCSYSLGLFFFLDEILAWPFFGKPFFGTRQYCTKLQLATVDVTAARSKPGAPSLVPGPRIWSIIVWVGDGASGRGRSILRMWFRCFRRAGSCFSCLRFGLFWVWFIGFGSSKLNVEQCSCWRVL